jgi:glycosyltransferase involved in cell wall biosynthesis
MPNPKVSIIIPVYNGSNFLSEAINSALSQTYDNTEIIVINDGSNDNGATDRICRSYKGKIRYYRKQNGGVASALNMGVKKMKGKYFSWLSHDDVYFPNKIKIQIDYLNRHNAEQTILYSDYTLINDKSIFLKRIKVKHVLPNEFSYALISDHLVQGCTTLIPKKAFDKIGLFDEKLITVQDYDLWFRLSEKYKFIHIPKPLVKNRIHQSQGTQTMSVLMYKEANSMFIKYLKDDNNKKLKNEPLDYLNFAFGLARKTYFDAADYAFALSKKMQKKRTNKLLFLFKNIYFFLIKNFYYLLVKLSTIKKTIYKFKI